MNLYQAILTFTANYNMHGRAYIEIAVPNIRMSPQSRRVWNKLLSYIDEVELVAEDKKIKIFELTAKVFGDEYDDLAKISQLLECSFDFEVEARIPTHCLNIGDYVDDLPLIQKRRQEQAINYLLDYYNLDFIKWEDTLSKIYRKGYFKDRQ